MLNTQCPACHQSMGVPAQAIGHKVRCPSCRHVWVVPPSARLAEGGASPESGAPAASGRGMSSMSGRSGRSGGYGASNGFGLGQGPLAGIDAGLESLVREVGGEAVASGQTPQAPQASGDASAGRPAMSTSRPDAPPRQRRAVPWVPILGTTLSSALIVVLLVLIVGGTGGAGGDGGTGVAGNGEPGDTAAEMQAPDPARQAEAAAGDRDTAEQVDPALPQVDPGVDAAGRAEGALAEADTADGRASRPDEGEAADQARGVGDSPDAAINGRSDDSAMVISTDRLSPQEQFAGSVDEPADVMAAVFGGAGDDTITDLVALADGDVLICGIIDGMDAVPGDVTLHRLLGQREGERMGFVARLSGDLQQMRWLSRFSTQTFRPTRMAVTTEGWIALGGEQLERLPGVAPDYGPDEWDGRQSAIARLSADGSTLEWIRPGGPNQTAVTGLDVDDEGRIYYTAGTRGARMAAYLLRVEPDGSGSDWPARPEEGRQWCVDLHHSAEDLREPDQFWGFYLKAERSDSGYYQYDGDDGWEVRWRLHGIRRGGPVQVLPDGDVVVAGSMQYDFTIRHRETNPAFDVFLARYSPEGELRWSTNLYQEGDSIHIPDQVPKDLHYCKATGDLLLSAWQHGSNVYRFKGNLVGDTGNLSIYWIGRIRADSGELADGWYFHNVRPGSNGRFTEDGGVTGWPSLSGNYIARVSSDARGRVYVTGRGAAATWTTPTAHQDWPENQSGGGFGFLYVLSQDFEQILYGTVLRGTEPGDEDGTIRGGAQMEGLAVTPRGVYIAGRTASRGFATGSKPAWADEDVEVDGSAALIRFQWPGQ